MARAMWWFRWSSVGNGHRRRALLLADSFRRRAERRKSVARVALDGRMGACMARGVCADLSVSNAAQRISRQPLGAHDRDCRDYDCCLVGRAGPEREWTIVECTPRDRHWRRNGIPDVAKHVGIVWRAAADRMDAREPSVELGTPMPPEAAHLARWAYLASRTGFWMSLPMLFFMGAAEHYPFLGGITD